MSHCTDTAICNPLATVWSHVLGLPTPPDWLGPLLFIYLVGAFVFGCPCCYLPNLAWPIDLLEHLKTSVEKYFNRVR